MTDELLTLTACGLYVVGRDPHQWPIFSWTQQVVDMEGDQEKLDALALIGKDLMSQLGTTVATGELTEARDIAFACLHAGTVARAEHVGMDYSDPEVTLQDIAAADGYAQRTWTVCGVVEETWRTTCIPATAGTPLVAYFRAWERCRDEFGGTFLLAAVHEGTHPAIEVFGYADPWARNQESMDAKARDWGL